jgi:hypothetical protein
MSIHLSRGQNMTWKMIVLAALTALAAGDASAQAVGSQFRAPNLSGVYQCVRSCSGTRLARIVARGWQLSLINEIGQAANAWIDWPGHIWIPALSEGAVYSPDGFTIQFDRGTVWVLIDPEPIPGFEHY